MKFGLILRLLIPTALIGAAWIGWLRYQASTCDTQTLFETTSPDNLHSARLNQTGCSYGAGVARDFYTVDISTSKQKADVFSIEELEPKLRWVGNNDLLISIGRPAWILTSKNHALGIAVRYEVPSEFNHAAVFGRIAALHGLLDNNIKAPGNPVTPSSLYMMKQFDAWLVKVSAKDLGS